MVARTEPATENSCTQTIPLSILPFLLSTIERIKQRNWLLIASPQETVGIFFNSQWQSSLNASPEKCKNNPSAEKIRFGCGSQSQDKNNNNEWREKWDLKQFRS